MKRVRNTYDLVQYQVVNFAHIFVILTSCRTPHFLGHYSAILDGFAVGFSLGALGRQWAAVGDSGMECVHLQPSPFDHLSLPDFRPECCAGGQEPHLSVYVGDQVRPLRSDRG